ncbi:uncharacterized protein LOC113469929, partial [Diaphorina citri]|uniref:Uncharacterized protein LOC113469929 n=1 Tax=Diaphorina citri TaxID=121845 RepID=A0A3Q0JAP9_DIACI
RIPYSIIGTSEDLFVEFVSSAAGPLLNTGFHFNVGNWPGHVETKGTRNGTCDWLLTADDLAANKDSEGIFLSIAHWYAPHTSCTYLIQGKPNQVVRLYFPSFRITRIQSGPTTPAKAAFKIVWTELLHLPRNQDGTVMTSRLIEDGTGDDNKCEFLCPGDKGVCIPARLVCNGVVNCPGTIHKGNGSSYLSAGDEALDLCATRLVGESANWRLIAVGACGGVFQIGVCIPARLVCNGVVNCPGTIHKGNGSSYLSAGDEALDLCATRLVGESANWRLIAVGACGGALLALVLIALIVRCCCRCCFKRADDEDDY